METRVSLFNPLKTNVPLICFANQLTIFYMRGSLVAKRVKSLKVCQHVSLYDGVIKICLYLKANSEMCSMEKFLNYTGLKKLFVCRHPTMGLRVESVGRDFFLFW